MPHELKRLAAEFRRQVWCLDENRLHELESVLDWRQTGERLSDREIETRLAQLTLADPYSGWVELLGPPDRAIRPQQKQSASNPVWNAESGQVALVSIQGTIVPRRIDAEDSSGGGFVSVEQISAAIQAVVNDPKVTTVVLDINSPGGSVQGIPELADQIYAARSVKPIIAVANYLAASAAYWLGAAATTLIASPSAELGSIGVLVIHQDESQKLAKAGVTTTIIRSVPDKAAASPYEPLSETAKADLEDKISRLHTQFVAAVARYRNVDVLAVAKNFGQGKTVSATTALSVGMVDRIATLADVLRPLVTTTASGATSSTPRGSTPHVSSHPDLTSRSFSPEPLTVHPQLLTALVRANLVDVNSPPDMLASALTLCLSAAGITSTASIGDQTAAIQLYAARTQLASQPTALADISSTGSVPPTPAPAPVATLSPQPATQPIAAGNGTTMSDIVAAVQISRLDPSQQMALLSEFSASATPVTQQQVIRRINELQVASQPSAGFRQVSVTEDAADKLAEQAQAAILMRCDRQMQADNGTVTVVGARGQEVAVDCRRPQYALQSLLGLSRQILLAANVGADVVNAMAPIDIAQAMFGAELPHLGLRADASYNVRGMFSNIFYNAQNVILRRSYEEAPTTFQIWARQGEAITDFKTVHRVIAGELPDPQVIPENGEFQETTMADGRESMRLVVWGEQFPTTWQMIVDDRLKAFTDIPRKQGIAMRRKQNKLCYGVLKDNAALENDSIALFHSSHANLAGSGGAVSSTTLNAMYAAMQIQPGLSSGTVLGIVPKYLLHPPLIRGTVKTVLTSTADTLANNSGVANIWNNALVDVNDAELSAAAGGSDTAWYGVADPNNSTVDTIEYAYLQGLETPQLRRVESTSRLATYNQIYIAFAVKAIDYRGVYKNPGA